MTDLEPIETERLRLVPMGSEVLAALADNDIVAAQRWVDYRIPPGFSLLARPIVRHRLRLIASDATQHPWMYRAILRRHDGALIGQISFHHKAPDPDLLAYVERGAELGYIIEPPHRRRGYASESAIAMMRWAAEHFGVRDYVLTVGVDNTASLRMAESMGFVRIGERQDPVDGPEAVMHTTIDRIVATSDLVRHRSVAP